MRQLLVGSVFLLALATDLQAIAVQGRLEISFFHARHISLDDVRIFGLAYVEVRLKANCASLDERTERAYDLERIPA